ncbi:MAG: biotin--[Clostridia bacterium]|nr:biotin--[acetyl-CoA-carboxylase] ligase [Clostridia bacterium]
MKLSEELICKYLRHSFIDVTVKETTVSTNTELKLAAESGAPEGTLLAADTQSAGRGRVGKSFFSPDGGLYMSLILRPDFDFKKSLHITTCAAVSTAEAIREVLGMDVGIKWVNDLFYKGKKVCGILTEAPFDSENGKIKYAVLGIGINVFEPETGYGDLSGIAGALLDGKPDGEVKSRLAAAVTDRFFDRYRELESKDLHEEYKRRLFVIGRDVTVLRGDITEKMTVIDLDSDYNLVLRRHCGETFTMSSGEISIIPV